LKQLPQLIRHQPLNDPRHSSQPNEPIEMTSKACFSAGGLMRHKAGGTTVWGKTGSGLGRSSGVFATGDGGRRLVYAYTPAAGATRLQQVNRVVEFVNAGFAG
ncbi:hypothetical protein ABZ311_34950, partial [Streptomyces sp. NPDC006183]